MPPDDTGPLWTAAFFIEGCPISSANVASLSVERLEFDLKRGGKAAAAPPTSAMFRLNDVVGVRKEILAWLQQATKRKLSRSIKVVLKHRGGGQRTYSLTGVFPTRWSHVDFEAAGNSGAVMAYELEVRVDRVEMA